MNAKELLKENPELTHYFEVSDGEAFEKEEYAQAHAKHFSRKYEKVVLSSPEEVSEKEVEELKDSNGETGVKDAQVNPDKDKKPIVVNTSGGPNKGSVVKVKGDEKAPDSKKEDPEPSDDKDKDATQ